MQRPRLWVLGQSWKCILFKYWPFISLIKYYLQVQFQVLQILQVHTQLIALHFHNGSSEAWPNQFKFQIVNWKGANSSILNFALPCTVISDPTKTKSVIVSNCLETCITFSPRDFENTDACLTSIGSRWLLLRARGLNKNASAPWRCQDRLEQRNHMWLFQNCTRLIQRYLTKILLFAIACSYPIPRYLQLQGERLDCCIFITFSARHHNCIFIEICIQCFTNISSYYTVSVY